MKKQQNCCLDGLSFKAHRPLVLDLPLAKFVINHKKTSVTYHRNRITTKPSSEKFTSLYLNQKELGDIRKRKNELLGNFSMDGFVVNRDYSRLDLKKTVVLRKREGVITKRIKEKYSNSLDYLKDLFDGSIEGVSVMRMWNVSMVSSVIFGMFLMTMIYRYLGQGVYADTPSPELSSSQSQTELAVASNTEITPSGIELNYEDGSDYDEYAAQLVEEYNSKVQESRNSDITERDIKKMVEGYPIEKMAPYIARKDRLVAAFLIAIAKKESSWGERVPVYEGKDCYNYWGFRGKSEVMGTGGHTCFASPEIAVDVVAKRIASLVYGEKMDTPAKMVEPWKCGYDCSWDNPEAVQKWIDDVGMYFDRYNDNVG